MYCFSIQMGFDGFFLGRIDYADKTLRLNTTEMEMIWQGSVGSLGSIADIFTGVLYNNYAAPHGFCFDSFCSDPPIMVSIYVCMFMGNIKLIIMSTLCKGIVIRILN